MGFDRDAIVLLDHDVMLPTDSSVLVRGLAK